MSYLKKIDEGVLWFLKIERAQEMAVLL
jgi:hypothetical protein